MRELEVLSNGHLKLDFAEWKEFFDQELGEWVRSQVKRMIEQALEAERDYHLQLGYYEHSPEFRMDYRNGYRLRDLATQLGLLRRLRVPRTLRRYRSQFLPRYKRAQPAVHELVRQAFLRGISIARWARCWSRCWASVSGADGFQPDARTEPSGRAVSPRPLRADYLYLFLDGVVLKVRDAGRKVRRRVVLVAYGITAQGRREVIAYQFAHNGESEACWTEFLQDLYQRGLQGQHLRLSSAMAARGWRPRCRWCFRAWRCSCAGRTSCATSPTRCGAAKAVVWRKPPECTGPRIARRRSGPSGSGNATGNSAAPKPWLAWNAIWSAC